MGASPTDTDFGSDPIPIFKSSAAPGSDG
ncbi:hypothetical protein CCACVL1_07817 [Corchorus capsularis]|uniref:Uncharacterized protein n=1 Tax=Corchorus capsularis TaxID=210143 RepID=A0A1R3J3T1_COCAP|nr:hypothetical protein CCACVL1_07817 [Corchorus capsularis]